MHDHHQEELNDLMKVRRSKLARLQELGINPFTYAFARDISAQEVVERFAELEEKSVSLAGRVMTLRSMGKAAFAHIADASGKIQIYVRRDQIGDQAYEVFDLTDIGDLVGVTGTVHKTRTGEITIFAQSFELLTKSLRPMPVVKERIEDGQTVTYDAFADTELRYRQRYVDLMVNREVRQTFITRSRIVSAMRRYLDGRGYLEVETPVLQPLYGGAAARPFVTHHNALDMTLYLRIADELYLKRLIVGGFEGVYEISKDFRNEGIDRSHNPEFTMMELYVAYQDYHFMMGLVEEMVSTITTEVCGGNRVIYQGQELDFTPPWPRIRLYDALQKYAQVDLYGKSRDELYAAAKALHCEVEPFMESGKILDEIVKEKVEPHLIQPTFLCDYPVELSPLAKRHRDDPRLVERFESFVAGREISNAFSELNDPIDQRGRFEEQMKAKAAGDEEAQVLDEDFLRALEHGMPPTAGLGMGIDRLTMLLTDAPSIRDVILFPTMRPEL
ncbi:MAG TPA: lysine--tRNA ligase [bacterium]|nr:lysine--tRNA ligase [bacterium]HPR88324.1 lysine--tRNA ligase [bacterium]